MRHDKKWKKGNEWDIYIYNTHRAKVLWSKYMNKEMIKEFYVFTYFSTMFILLVMVCFDNLYPYGKLTIVVIVNSL